MVRQVLTFLELVNDRTVVRLRDPEQLKPVLTMSIPTISGMNRSLFRHHKFQMNLSMMHVAHGDDLPIAHLDFSDQPVGELRVVADERDTATVVPVQLHQLI